jgi:hypothetical protein
MAKEHQIRVSCHTSLDGYNLHEIQEIACRPMVGDYVAVKTKSYPYHDKLRIVSICHHYISSHREASIEIELNK